MGEVRFMISEAAKQVQVESHVLRYWEEELDLKIGRTEMGHRYYTEDDIQLFRCIKKLKNEGMLLRDLKPLIPELRATREILTAARPTTEKPAQTTEPLHSKTQTTSKKQAASNKAADSKAASVSKGSGAHNAAAVSSTSDTSQIPAVSSSTSDSEISDKPKELAVTQAEVIPVTQLEQVRSLIGDVLTEVVTTNNTSLEKNISRKVTADVIREMDFLFQAKERQEEEHYRKLDCLIRQQQANRREASKVNPLGKLKKILT